MAASIKHNLAATDDAQIHGGFYSPYRCRLRCLRIRVSGRSWRFQLGSGRRLHHGRFVWCSRALSGRARLAPSSSPLSVQSLKPAIIRFAGHFIAHSARMMLETRDRAQRLYRARPITLITTYVAKAKAAMVTITIP